MKKEYCDIFNSCFPQFRMTYERFADLMENENTVCYEYSENGTVTAFAVTDSAAVRLICVTPSEQGRGIGRKLLAQAEKDMAAKGHSRIITGGVSSRLFIGAVAESWGFFKKCGYDSVGGCDEMLLELKDFSYDESNFHGHDTAVYGWFEGDMNEIHEAVAKVNESWVQYFTDPKKIYAARVNGSIASFCLVDVNCQNYLTDAFGRVGMPGCVGTVPMYRRKGIAIEMIAKVTQYLKEQGMDISFIFFTGVAEWYEKTGYRTFLSEIFGEKFISAQ